MGGCLWPLIWFVVISFLVGAPIDSPAVVDASAWAWVCPRPARPAPALFDSALGLRAVGVFAQTLRDILRRQVVMHGGAFQAGTPSARAEIQRRADGVLRPRSVSTFQVIAYFAKFHPHARSVAHAQAKKSPHRCQGAG